MSLNGPTINQTGESANHLNASSRGHRRQISVPRTTETHQVSHENEPWESKNVLSLDGGGVRGYYSLLFIEQLMEHINTLERSFSNLSGNLDPATSSFHPHDKPAHVSHKNPNNQYVYLPCHYFDYICGTSTGGLIAIMLSRFRMTVDDCKDEYTNLGTQVFGSPRRLHSIAIPIIMRYRTKYNSARLEEVIEDVSTRRGQDVGENRNAFKSEKDDFCKTFVCAYKQTDNQAANQPFLFRTYDHYNRVVRNSTANSEIPHTYPRNKGEASSLSTLNVALATTAAPLYFDPLTIYENHGARILPRKSTFSRRGDQANVSQPRSTYIDGGFGEQNNPAKEAYYEVLTSNENIGTLVSVGTGRKNADRFRKGLRHSAHAAFDVAGDTEVTHTYMSGKSGSNQDGFPYFRFNEPEVLADMALDEWKPRDSGRKSIRKMEQAFSNWAIKPVVQESLRTCASQLVRRRRLRAAADPSLWEAFSLGAYYDCGENKCDKPTNKRWYRRSDFEGHWRECHNGDALSERQFSDVVDGHRDFWKYKAPPAR